MDYNPQRGDIILIDSNKTPAKIVKFLMQSPNWVSQLIRWFTHKLKFIPYYHVVMIINDGFAEFTGQADIIEQQGKVQLSTWKQDAIQIIFRRKYLKEEYKSYLSQVARNDIGKGYDILSIIGKTATWLTGIPLFSWFVQWPGAEICVNRVAMWYYKTFGEKFGQVTVADLTTQEMYEYLMKSDDYEVVFTKP